MRKVAAILLAVLLLCGCSNPSAYTPTGNALDEAGMTQPTILDGQQPQNFSLVYDPSKTLNPYTCTDQNNRLLFSLLYQGLFSLSPDYEVEPQLCKSYSVSTDGRTYVFYVQPAKFTDGSYLTAADVVASLEAARSNAVYSGRLYNVQSVTLTSDGGVQVQLATAYDNLPLLLDIPILRASQVNTDFPAGTGPYALQSGVAGRWLRLRQDWWCTAELPIDAKEISLVTAVTP